MKNSFIFFFLFSFSLVHAQSLSIDFETTITTADFIDFDGGMATVIPNPQSNGINTSSNVAQIIRDGGAIWAGSKIEFPNNLDFTTLNTITMKVFTTAPIGTLVKFKLEGANQTERDVPTTLTNEWEIMTWDFTGAPADLTTVVFMFDFGNIGDGSENSTFLFDDVEQFFGGFQIDLPVDFEGEDVNYSTTDFGGNKSFLVTDPTNSMNTVVQVIKTDQAATWAGTTIGTPAGFATNIPLTLSDAKMTVRLWSPEAGIPIRLKIEDATDPTHTCETETNTSVAGDWEVIEFDFENEAPGTQSLSVGLDMGWTYNMASIFFNFGIEGAQVGEQSYYFDDVKFGGVTVSTFDDLMVDLKVFPNPTYDEWLINSSELITLIELYDSQGRLVFVQESNKNELRINGAELPGGIFFARLTMSKGSKFVRLVKR